MKHYSLDNIFPFGVMLPSLSKTQSREKVLKFIQKPKGNFHVASLNPEIFVEISRNPEFKEAVRSAQMHLIDGIGVSIGARVLGIRAGERYAGVDFMDDMMEALSSESSRIMLIGGEAKVAETLADCYLKKYPRLNVRGIQGIKDIRKPTAEEEQKIFSIVADMKPQMIFVSFGSPAQELWIHEHQAQLSDAVCAGVGGAFGFLSGTVPRAPIIIRKLGLEWAYRLITQPWRWKRQLRLIAFMWLVIIAKLHKRG